MLNVSADVLLNRKPYKIDLEVGKPLLKRFEKAKALSSEKQKLIIDLIDNLSKE